ncbi:MAG: hypothetical protein ACRDRG_04020 [Pseudonocardiaceae bacterium]
MSVSTDSEVEAELDLHNVAQHSRATDRLLVTTDDQAGFAELPDVRVRVLSP